jgi:hypothetical protein
LNRFGEREKLEAGSESGSLKLRSDIMAKRTPPPESQPPPSLAHDQDRKGGQPYAKEVEDYAHGVAKPPKDQGGPEHNSRLEKAPKKR